MKFKKLIVPFCLVVLFSFGSSAHHHSHDDLEDIVHELATTPSTLETEKTYFQFGGELIALKRSAFQALVTNVIREKKRVQKEVCALCVPTNDQEEKNLLDIAKAKVVEISAFAYRGFKQYGIPYAAFFVLFEATEHSILAWLPPMCPLYQAGYFAAAQFLGRMKLLFAHRTGLKFNERLLNLASSIYLDIAFWTKFRKVATPSLPIVENDLDYIFSEENQVERYWLAMQHTKGLTKLTDFLNDVVSEKLENREIKVGQAFGYFGQLGSIDKEISRYRHSLRLYALADATSFASGETFASRKQEMRENLDTLIQRLKDLSHALPGGCGGALGLVLAK